MKYWNHGIGPNAIFIVWNRSQMKLKRSQIWFAHCGIGPVIGTIPSIPIPLANFGMELTFNSNPSLWICPTAPTPIQWSGDDSNVWFEIIWKSWEPGVTSGFFGLLVKPGWREGNSNIWNPLEPPILWNWSWNWHPNFSRGVGIGSFQKSITTNRNRELDPIIFQWMNRSHWNKLFNGGKSFWCVCVCGGLVSWFF